MYREYQARLHKAGAMDFDDLLVQTVELFKRSPDALERYRQRFRHVMVDEYQDTNHVQNELVLLLGAEHRNVCVVGDSDQSIYNFRGADISNILEFEEAFPDASVILLEQNYRSTQTVLDAANAVIAHNTSRKPKELFTEIGAGDKIVRFSAEDESDESGWVAAQAAQLHDGGEFRWGDMAVFYRTNAQSRVIEEQLMRSGIPYRVIGGTRFYDRREIKDAVAYVKAVVNPDDEVAMKRIVNVPKRGVGESSVGRIDAFARAHGLTFFEALRRHGEAGVSGRAVRGIDAFISLIDTVAPQIPEGPAHLLETCLEASGYLEELQAEGGIEAEGRAENLAELIGLAREFDTVDEFLEQISLVSDTDQIESEDDSNVVLMTLHSAKGLEYDAVFLIGMEEGVFPHMRTLGEPDQLEEERRLAYVGITRARRRLFVSSAWSRMLHGSTQYNPPSRFLDEIPSELVDETGRKRRRRGSYGEGATWGSGSGDSGWSPRTWDDTPVSGNTIGAGTRESIAPNKLEKSGADSIGIQVGDDVRHAKWGDGVVLDLRGDGDKAEATVRFPQVGEKVLLLAWAPLERLPAG